VTELEETARARREAVIRRLAAAESAARSISSLEPPAKPERPSNEIEAEIGRLETARRGHEAYEDALRRSRALERSQQDVKVLELEAKTALSTLLSGTKASAEEAVQRFLPPGFSVVLETTETACAWKIVGADGAPHGIGSMSGAEEAALILALCLAWPENGPRYVVLDDKDLGLFSPTNLRALLSGVEALQKKGDITQAFVCWTRRDEIPPGWQIVDCDEVERRLRPPKLEVVR